MGSIPVGGAIYKRHRFCDAFYRSYALKNELNPSKRSFETFALSVTIAQRIFGRKSGFRFPFGVPQADCITFVDRFFISIAETIVRLLYVKGVPDGVG